jgi:hypothetical protein
MTTSLDCATSLDEAAAGTPSFSSASTAAGTMSKTVTG